MISALNILIICAVKIKNRHLYFFIFLQKRVPNEASAYTRMCFMPIAITSIRIPVEEPPYATLYRFTDLQFFYFDNNIVEIGLDRQERSSG